MNNSTSKQHSILLVLFILIFSIAKVESLWAASKNKTSGTSGFTRILVSESTIGHPFTTEKQSEEYNRRIQVNKMHRLSVIQAATTGLDIQYFEWNDDKITKMALAYTIKKAAEGVPVRIIFDEFGAKAFPKKYWAYITDPNKSKIQVRVFNPAMSDTLTLPHVITYRMHDKGISASTQNQDVKYFVGGGQNASGKYFGLPGVKGFDDLHFVSDGFLAQQHSEYFEKLWNSSFVKDIVHLGWLGDFDRFCIVGNNCTMVAQQNAQQEVASVEREFMELFAEIESNIATITPIEDLLNVHQKNSRVVSIPNSQVAFLHDPPDITKLGTRGIFPSIQEMVKSFKDKNIGTEKPIHVVITAPYLVPDKTTIENFKTLVGQYKFNIVILTNSVFSTDGMLAQAGYMSVQDDLLDADVHIYEYKGPNTLHAKVGVFMGPISNLSLIGSFNMDRRSQNLNRELAMATTEESQKPTVDQTDRQRLKSIPSMPI